LRCSASKIRPFQVAIIHPQALEERKKAAVAEIQGQPPVCGMPRPPEHGQHEFDDLEVRGPSADAVELGAELQRRARGRRERPACAACEPA
jgi:hypothetical protein